MSGPLILALDTATDAPTLALGTPDAPGTDVRLEDRRALSRDIGRVAAALLAGRGALPRDLGAVLVADGPGSFTGLRIGAAFAKGLCRALGVPLLTAPSLLGAAAHAASAAGTARPADVEVRYDALRGQAYRAVYRVGAGAVEVREAVDLVEASGGPPEGGAPLRAHERHASAAALLALVGCPGGPAAVAGPAHWEPEYGRPAEAEARRLREGRGAAHP